MVPEARSPELFNWAACQASLDRARAALEGENPDAAAELRRAFAGASRMAEHCYDEIIELELTEALEDATFDDWKTFLSAVFKDAWKVYPKHSVVGSDNEKDLQETFENIRKAAEDALFDLLDLKATPVGQPSGRRPLVNKLRKLVEELDGALSELGPQPTPGAVHRVEEIRKADEPREAAENNDAHQASDADDADDAYDASDAAEKSTGIAPAETVSVPLLGRIAAGGPILAEESIEDIFPLPKQLVGDGELFLLKVDGDSMINASIASGDWVVVRRQPEAENGEIVAAMIGGEATVKTFKQSGKDTWLEPRNPAFTRIPAREAEILGKVVAVLRRV